MWMIRVWFPQLHKTRLTESVSFRDGHTTHLMGRTASIPWEPVLYKGPAQSVCFIYTKRKVGYEPGPLEHYFHWEKVSKQVLYSPKQGPGNWKLLKGSDSLPREMSSQWGQTATSSETSLMVKGQVWVQRLWHLGTVLHDCLVTC